MMTPACSDTGKVSIHQIRVELDCWYGWMEPAAVGARYHRLVVLPVVSGSSGSGNVNREPVAGLGKAVSVV